MTDRKEKFTVVQHSAYGYQNDPVFKQGLESRRVSSKEAQRSVESAGGVLFDSHQEAEDFAMKEMYNDPDYPGIIPDARGTFADQGVDGLAIYRPQS